MSHRLKTYLQRPVVRESMLFFVLAVSLLVYSLAGHRQISLPWKLSPYLFPLLVSLFLLILSFCLFAEGVRSDQKGASCRPFPKTEWRNVLATLAFCLAYYFAMPHIGFILSTIVFLVLLFLLLGERRPLVVGTLSVATSVVIYYLFHVLLHVMLP
ncbi:MAG: tripartite tricarboxylate transporter TctB family protein [Sphaerochaetaceae bacterium]|nr:tripartite tricarboxylate transporter TctB family protein [Spirochaetales bacterium]MDY5499848.1 tripartite tricarboxylate transporter TctB family protein [Sphaerochaetaceae bacterium]